MLTKKRLSLNKLISYVQSISSVNINPNDNEMDVVFSNQVKSNDEFTFEVLKYPESKNINDFSEKTRKIFDPFIKDFKRHGSRPYFDNPDVNMTMYFSIMSQLFPNFYKLPQDKQLMYITKLRDRLVIYISNDTIFIENGYDKLQWNKKDTLNSLVQFKSNKIVLKILADYFQINIFIVNILEDKIYVISSNDYYDMFRQNIIISCHEENFEHVTYSGKHLLDYTSEPIKKLLNVEKSFICFINPSINNKDYIPFRIMFDNFDKFIDVKEDEQKIESNTETVDDTLVNNYDEIYPNESDDVEYVKDIESDNIGIKQNNDNDEVVFNISSKMKLDEVKAIAEKLLIDTTKNVNGKKKPKIKNELIKDIQDKLKSISNISMEINLKN